MNKEKIIELLHVGKESVITMVTNNTPSVLLGFGFGTLIAGPVALKGFAIGAGIAMIVGGIFMHNKSN